MLKKYWRWILLGLVIVMAMGGIGVGIATRPADPMPQALAAMQSDSQVQVSTQPWLEFKPRANEPTTGLIFYPGALVDPRAYAPMARDIAARGYLVVIVPMPLNLAFFDANRASDVIAKFGSIKHWAMGGHSLGGVAAAMFVKNHPETIQGVVFWASYPADSLVDFHGVVDSISGSNDGLATPAKVDASRGLLPAATQFVVINGGNHAQFGWYGLQNGDGAATISREEQQVQVVGATIDALKQLGN